eukprot:Selendium_serpulae@DN5758_c0_g1_i9.p1
MFVPAYGTHEYPFLASEILADRAVETKRDLITTGLEEELKVELCKARVAVPEALVAGAVGIQGSQFYLTLIGDREASFHLPFNAATDNLSLDVEIYNSTAVIQLSLDHADQN